jgi:hypothetical protein
MLPKKEILSCRSLRYRRGLTRVSVTSCANNRFFAFVAASICFAASTALSPSFIAVMSTQDPINPSNSPVAVSLGAPYNYDTLGYDIVRYIRRTVS